MGLPTPLPDTGLKTSARAGEGGVVAGAWTGEEFSGTIPKMNGWTGCGKSPFWKNGKKQIALGCSRSDSLILGVDFLSRFSRAFCAIWTFSAACKAPKFRYQFPRV